MYQDCLVSNAVLKCEILKKLSFSKKLAQTYAQWFSLITDLRLFRHHFFYINLFQFVLCYILVTLILLYSSLCMYK